MRKSAEGGDRMPFGYAPGLHCCQVNGRTVGLGFVN